MAAADSAGLPWEGRSFEHDASAFAGDDGSAPEQLIEAIRRFRVHELGEREVVDAVRDARLLVALVADLGESAPAHGHLHGDKSAELSIVTVAGPDGRSVLPAFTSVAAMSAWNPKARPVPASAVRVALAAASEQTDLVVLDATSPTEFVLRRPAVWAIAQSRPWLPSYLDDEVLRAFEAVCDPRITGVRLAPGDPEGRLSGPELVVTLLLVPGLDRAALDELLAVLQNRWAADEVIATRVDSMRVALAAA